FFSSRRRHTRFSRDWSSDVCSSDLYYLSVEWLPLGTETGTLLNVVFVLLAIGLILAALWLLVVYYEQILRWALANRWKFMILPIATLLLGLLAWMGVEKSFGFLADGMEKAGWKSFRETVFWKGSTKTFPGMGEEFMPSLNEGSFLL